MPLPILVDELKVDIHLSEVVLYLLVVALLLDVGELTLFLRDEAGRWNILNVCDTKRFFDIDAVYIVTSMIISITTLMNIFLLFSI